MPDLRTRAAVAALRLILERLDDLLADINRSSDGLRTSDMTGVLRTPLSVSVSDTDTDMSDMSFRTLF